MVYCETQDLSPSLQLHTNFLESLEKEVHNLNTDYISNICSPININIWIKSNAKCNSIHELSKHLHEKITTGKINDLW